MKIRLLNSTAKNNEPAVKSFNCLRIITRKVEVQEEESGTIKYTLKFLDFSGRRIKQSCTSDNEKLIKSLVYLFSTYIVRGTKQYLNLTFRL